MLRFSEIRKYVSRVSPISVCLTDGSYFNYHLISDIPDKYDELYVHGVGMIDSEQDMDVFRHPGSANEISHGRLHFNLAPHLEIVVDKEPKYDDRIDDKAIVFKDLRRYMDRISPVTIWRMDDDDISFYDNISKVPDDYDLRHVYGVGLYKANDSVMRMEHERGIEYRELGRNAVLFGCFMEVALIKEREEDN